MPTLASRPVAPEGIVPSRWIYFLHGMYGAGRNWASLARRLVDRRPDWGAVLVDLRLHGGSVGFEPPHTLEACARDVEELAGSLDPRAPLAATLGHSFGGKVALALLRRDARRLPRVWVVDSTPSAGPPGGAAAEMLEALREIPGPFESREAARRGLEARGFEPFVGAWMATNLEPGEEGLGWRFDPATIEALLDDFFRTDLWSVVEEPPPGVSLHFVKASDSGVLGEEACRRIEAAGRETGRVHLHRVAGGHWVNADNPQALLELLERHLPRG